MFKSTFAFRSSRTFLKKHEYFLSEAVAKIFLISFRSSRTFLKKHKTFPEAATHLLKHKKYHFLSKAAAQNILKRCTFSKFLWFKTSHKNILRTVLDVIFCRL